jgi:hypothetical protein
MCLNSAVRRIWLAVLILCVCCAGMRAQTRANDEIGEVFASDAAVRGNMVLASGGGTRVLSGSQVTAGLTTARLQIARGGYARICPNTGLSISGWRNRELLLAMNSGAVELNYRNNQFVDALVTPDFRIQLSGPADVHLAVQVDAAGNTCIRSLAKNTVAPVIFESMGTGSFKLEAGQSVLFSHGHLTETSEPTAPCGCAEPEHPVQVAEETQPTAPPAEGTAPPMLAPQPTAAHVVMEAPFVYKGDAMDPELFQKAAKLSVREDDPFYHSMLPKVTPPPKTSSGGGGFFHRIGRVFKRIFAS